MEDLKNEIYEALVQAQDNMLFLHDQIKGNHIIIFLGNTRSGKSTLINYVLKNKLVAFQQRRGVYKIKKADEEGPGPQIGQGTLSKTAVPGIYKKGGYVIIDAPGFDDNRGEAQDIINALYINQIQHCLTCKLVLVADISDITNDNIGNFLRLISHVRKLIPNTEKLKYSTSLLLTKDSMAYKPYEIATIIREHIVRNTKLRISDDDRDFADCFAKRINLIGILRMPTAEGPLTKDSCVNLKEAIAESAPANLGGYQVGFVVASDARLALYHLYEEFVDKLDFKTQLDKPAAPFIDYFDAEYLLASDDFELLFLGYRASELYVDLNKCYTVKNLQSILENMQDLCELDANEEFYKTLALFAMLDEASLVNERFQKSIISKYQESLQSLRCPIKALIADVETEKKGRADRKYTNTIVKFSSATAVVAGTAATGFAESAFATGAVALACSGLGGVLIVGGAFFGLALIISKDQMLKTRTKIRESQGRHIQNEHHIW